MGVTDTRGESLSEHVRRIVARAREAQRTFAKKPQSDIDLTCLAAARPLLNPGSNRELCTLAVTETQLGNVADKQRKNVRKTLGLLRDIQHQRTVGVIHEDVERGIIEIARPVGVVGALTPSTNPLATPVNNMINALKGGNGIVLAPPPQAAKTSATLLERVHAEFDRINIPRDLVQMLLPPVKEATVSLMREVDFLVVTGSQRNVRAGYSSGTSAIGVGVGNVAVIIDETADLADAAKKITDSKTFDNATSCSSENHLVIVDAVYEPMMQQLARAGGVLLNPADTEKLAAALWREGALNRELVAKDLAVFVDRVGLSGIPADARFLMVDAASVAEPSPFWGEKLSLTLTVHRVSDFVDAKVRAGQLLDYQGAGHSIGIHTKIEQRPLELGLELPACRVIVNQAHCFAAGGSFDNGLPFSLSMGCGSWGGNSISDNLNFRHFINTVRIVRAIEPREPTIEEIYQDYPGGTP